MLWTSAYKLKNSFHENLRNNLKLGRLAKSQTKALKLGEWTSLELPHFQEILSSLVHRGSANIDNNLKSFFIILCLIPFQSVEVPRQAGSQE